MVNKKVSHQLSIRIVHKIRIYNQFEKLHLHTVYKLEWFSAYMRKLSETLFHFTYVASGKWQRETF